MVLDNVIDLIFFSVPIRGGINQLKLTLNDLAIVQKMGVTGRDSSNNPARFVKVKDLQYWLLSCAPFPSMVEQLHLNAFDWENLEASVEKSWQLALQWEEERLDTLIVNTGTRRQVIRSLRSSPLPTTATLGASPRADEREDKEEERGGEIKKEEAIIADTLLHSSPYPHPIRVSFKLPSPRFIAFSSAPPIVIPDETEEEVKVFEAEEVMDAIIMPNPIPSNSVSVDLKEMRPVKKRRHVKRGRPRKSKVSLQFECPYCDLSQSSMRKLQYHVKLTHERDYVDLSYS